ncbi:hypothetical protein Nepgr_014438 [Nepenthes gracilis]|uniref:Uncharacterized protein n=1 Tax=Nepenthes gracilis TaxID=150966 RepID=A0AAD3XPH7_NEPGR|nr:hypothetical protein Nepgr_014438 [Nepenthes gracilis]
MSFTDMRRFAKVRLLDDPASVPPISELGPDALLEPMSVDELYSSLRKKKLGIKALLLDQSQMACLPPYGKTVRPGFEPGWELGLMLVVVSSKS